MFVRLNAVRFELQVKVYFLVPQGKFAMQTERSSAGKTRRKTTHNISGKVDFTTVSIQNKHSQNKPPPYAPTPPTGAGSAQKAVCLTLLSKYQATE